MITEYKKVVNKKEVINTMFVCTLGFIRKYSESVFSSLSIAWNNLVSSNSANKKKKAIEKLNKNIEKLKLIENKKGSMFNEDVEVYLLKYLNDAYLDKLITSRYEKQLVEVVKNINFVSDLLIYLVDVYSELHVITKTKKEVLELPKLKNDIKEVEVVEKVMEEIPEKKVSFVVDKTGHTYYHVKLVKDVMTVDEESFLIEKKKYREALKHGTPLFENDNNVKLSPYEKKRRIFIQGMYELEYDLNRLESKEIDITYPIDKFFKLSSLFVDNLYQELVNANYKNMNNNLYVLTDLTYKTFGCNRLLEKYDYIASRLDSRLVRANKEVSNELILKINEVKEKQYVDFKNIEGLVPTLFDVYRVLNKKILKTINLYIKDLSKNVDVGFKKLIRYMSVDEIKSLYSSIVCMIRKEELPAIRINKYLVELQQSACEVLSRRMKTTKDDIVYHVLKEEKLF